MAVADTAAPSNSPVKGTYDLSLFLPFRRGAARRVEGGRLAGCT